MSNNFSEKVPQIDKLWLLIEFICVAILISIPAMWSQNLNQTTLTQGVILAIFFLLPVEILRQFVGYKKLRQLYVVLIGALKGRSGIYTLQNRVDILERQLQDVLGIKEEISSLREIRDREEGSILDIINSLHQRIDIILQRREGLLYRDNLLTSVQSEVLLELIERSLQHGIHFANSEDKNAAMFFLRSSIELSEKYGKPQNEAYIAYYSIILGLIEEKDIILRITSLLNSIQKNIR